MTSVPSGLVEVSRVSCWIDQRSRPEDDLPSSSRYHRRISAPSSSPSSSVSTWNPHPYPTHHFPRPRQTKAETSRRLWLLQQPSEVTSKEWNGKLLITGTGRCFEAEQ